MNYADEIRDRVPASELLPFYGMNVDRAGFCTCPFHQGDKNGSLKVYPGDRGWHCFGCGAGSSVVDFVMQYFGLSFLDAQKKINDDFRLGLSFGERLSTRERAEAAEKVRKQQERARAWENRKKALQSAVDKTLTAYVILDKWLLHHKPTGGMIAHRDAAWYNYQEAEYELEKFLATRACIKS